MNWKRFTVFSAIDIAAAFICAFLFLALFFIPLQTELLNAINTIEYEQTAQGMSANITSTEMVTVILVGIVILFYLIFFLTDSIKVFVASPKKKRWNFIGKNAINWLALFCLTFIIGIILQELYFFFSFIQVLTWLYVIIVCEVFVLLIFWLLVVGKKKLFMKKFNLKQAFIQWVSFGLLAGILFSTFQSAFIGVTLFLFLLLGNYTFTFATKA